MGSLKTFIEKKLRNISLKLFLIRIPFYILTSFLFLILVMKSEIMLIVILRGDEPVTLIMRVYTLIFRIVFYLLPAIVVAIIQKIRRKTVSFKCFLMEIQYFIVFLICIAFIMKLVSLPGEDNSVFEWGTGVVLVALTLIIEYIDFKNKSKIIRN